jgi:DNA-binding transcriptional ArsR family regulator
MMAPAPAQPVASTEEQAELLRVLGHPMRLAILKELTGGERSVGDVAERTGLGLSVLSQQLAILRKAALVSSRREAKQVFYAIDADQMKAARFILDALLPASEAGDVREDTRPAGSPDANARLGAAMFAQVSRVTR